MGLKIRCPGSIEFVVSIFEVCPRFERWALFPDQIRVDLIATTDHNVHGEDRVDLEDVFPKIGWIFFENRVLGDV